MADNLPDVKTSSSITVEDTNFVIAKESGMSSINALVQAYQSDEDIQMYAELRDDKNKKTRDYASLMLRRKAYDKIRTKKISLLTDHYKQRITSLGNVALDTLEEIMVDGSSEKVRAEVAIEMLRHNVGSPDRNEKNDTNVVVMIGTNPANTAVRTVIDGEVVDER